MSAVATRIETDEQVALRDHLRTALARTWDDRLVLSFADADASSASALSLVLQETFALADLLGSDDENSAQGTWLDATIVAEELGAALAPNNVLGDVMAAFVLRAAGTHTSGRVLTELTQAHTRTAVMWPGDDARWDTSEVGASIGSRVSGEWSNVPELSGCSLLLLPSGGEGLAIARLDGGAAFAVEETLSPDPLRPLHRVVLSGAPVELVPVASGTFRGAVAMGAVVLAAEMVGGAAACLERAVEYTTSRTQFGRSISSFQSTKHRLADVVVAIEAARSITYRAAERATSSASVVPDDLEFISLARAAKAASSDALHLAATECIQMHGAMGFTWEIPAHLYLKRWACSGSLYGRAFELRRLLFRAEIDARSA